ncbi:MAG TPA: prepilin-type N-terminal cleavage/methylation domain-containing protein [Candidatus Pacearchaeota archaeon]|nr:prepilin-type N-terminal cleavage/methylation domain-containing protein [Candidatus Pacearchaeota archaeon]
MNKNKSFTLIELLVVIVIIGILAGVIMISTSSSIDKANIAKGEVFSESIKNNLILNLVSEWNFDNSSNPTQDAWGSNAGTVFGATYKDESSQKCVSGGCYSFDGNDYIIFTNNNIPMGSDVFTISVWVYLNVHDVSRIITWWGNAAINNANALRIGPVGYFRHYFYSNDYDVYTGDLSNKWSHVVLEHIGAGDRIFYLNGLKISGSYVGTKTSPDVQPTDIYIGARAGSLEFFNGLIDDIKIYNSNLPQALIRENYVVGLDSLLLKGLISKEEYNQRLNELAYEQ